MDDSTLTIPDSELSKPEPTYQLPKYALDGRVKPPSLASIAREVMSGEWGYGEARDKKLMEKGYDLNEVYDKIDEMFGKTPDPFQPYDIIITVGALNVRQGPSMEHYIIYTLVDDRTHYTIVEEAIDDNANIWGFLRSGLGWINLQFTKRVDDIDSVKMAGKDTEV